MEKNEDISFKNIINNLNRISKDIEKVKPFAEIKEVKKFNKSGHIILPKELVNQEVLIIKFPNKEQFNKS